MGFSRAAPGACSVTDDRFCDPVPYRTADDSTGGRYLESLTPPPDPGTSRPLRSETLRDPSRMHSSTATRCFAMEVAAALLALLTSLSARAGVIGPELLRNGDFEAPYSADGLAEQWTYATWGGAQATLTKAWGAKNSRGSQKVSVDIGSTGFVLKQLVEVQRNRLYRVTMLLKSDAPTSASVAMTDDNAPFKVWGSKTLALDTAWRRASFVAWVTVDGQVRIAISPTQAPSTFYVDNATVRDITDQQVENGDLEEGFSSIGTANRWQLVSWTTNGLTGAMTTTPAAGRNDGSGQRIQLVQNPGQVIFQQSLQLIKGRVYEASAWIRTESPTPVPVRMSVRKNTAWYNTWGIRTVDATPSWKQVRFLVTPNFDDPSRLQFALVAPGSSIDIDDVSLSDVTDSHLPTLPLAGQSVPVEYFGMHNHQGHINSSWERLTADSGVGLIRLWDSGTTWRMIETSRGVFDWNRLRDIYISRTKRSGTGVKILYTFGETPAWANSSGDKTLPPDNLDDWRDYVSALVNEVGHDIDYWEIWNEADITTFWQGSMQQLFEMQKIAYQIIKAHDPAAIVLLPNFTTTGLARLDELLRLGAGEYADGAALHLYPPADDHYHDWTFAIAVRDLLDAHGLQHFQIFNTEGSAVKTSSTSLSSPETRGAVARFCLMNWASGLRMANWYSWDNESPSFLRMVDDFATLTTLSEAGQTRERIADWLIGHTMDSLERNPTTGVSTLTLSKGQRKRARVLWVDGSLPDAQFSPPQEWAVQTIRQLDGTDNAYAGGSIMVGREPVMLVSDTRTLPRLLAHYPLDDTASQTSAIDISEFARHATLVTPDADTLGVPGKEDNAISFGAGPMASWGMTASGDSMSGMNKFSIAFWVRPGAGFSQYNSFGQKLLVSYGDYLLRRGFQVLGNLDNTLSLRIYDGTNMNQTTTAMPPVGVWTRVVATYDGDSLKLFYDGVLRTSKATSKAMVPMSGGHLIIGRFFKGEIDDVKLYNYPLPTDAVQAQSALLARYRFESTGGNTVIDSVGTHHGSAASGSVDISTTNAPEGNGSINMGNAVDGDQITVADAPALRQTRFTVAAWLRPERLESLGGTKFDKTIVGKSDVSAKQGFALLWKVDGRLALRIYDGTKFIETGSLLPPTSNWVHVAGVYDGVSLTVYINGDPVATMPAATPMNVSTAPMVIGRNLRGGLDDLRVYSQALSPAAVRELRHYKNF